MARTTGYPCVIVARMLADGTFTRPGVFPPELLGREPGILERMLRELSARGVHVHGGLEESVRGST
jgi:saccharopine dehydrogenase-like NADP-dependent oxidoreductase